MSNNLIAGPGPVEGGAQIINPVLGDLGNKTGVDFFKSFIPGLIGLAFVAGVIIFFFMLILGAIQWISSGGDKQALEGARGRVTNAIIGLVILFSLFAVLDLIHVFFGITIMTLDIGPLVIQ
jgi:succinate dehydrogenase/fumarate reductase cytochrome b subunit